MTQDTPQLRQGEVIGRYRILGEIGRGAMAVVYLAEESDRRRKVAIKVLLPKYENDPAYVTRFINEARAAAALSHPNIIEALDIGYENSMHYFCMEYVEGRSLQQLIEEKGPIPLEQLLEIAEKIASALEYGWSRHGLTHGDIKPENIMLTWDGDVRLADFGLANMRGHERKEQDIILTPHYAAPELIKGESQCGDCRADIYAFGATLYHGFTGTTLFKGSNAQDILDKQVHENPEPLSLRHPETPPALSRLISRMLSKQPDERPGDWTAVISELGNIHNMCCKASVKKSQPQVLNIPNKLPVRKDGKTASKKLGYFILASGLVLFLSWCIIIGLLIYKTSANKKTAPPRDTTVNIEISGQQNEFSETSTAGEVPEEDIKKMQNIGDSTSEKVSGAPSGTGKSSAVQPASTEKAAKKTTKKPAKKTTKPQVKSPDRTAKKIKAKKQSPQKKEKTTAEKRPQYTSVPDSFTVKLGSNYTELESKYDELKSGPAKNTVNKVRELQSACKTENFTAIAQAAKRILDDITMKLDANDRAAIEAIREGALMRQPSSLCKKLENEAEQMLNEKNYRKALALALTARARYASKRKDIAAKALENISAANSKQYTEIPLPFSQPLHFWEYMQIYSSRNFPAGYCSAYELSLLQPAGDLYLGDWSAGTDIKRIKTERQIAQQRDTIPTADNAVLAAFGFAGALLSEFVWEGTADWSWLDSAYEIDKADRTQDAGAMVMAVSAAIIVHNFPGNKIPAVNWSGSIKLGGTDLSKKLLAYLLFTYYKERGEKSKLSELISVLKTAPENFGFKESPSLVNGTISLQDIEKDDYLKWAYFRAWIACSSNAKGLDGAEDSTILKIMSSDAEKWSVQGGEAIYAWLLNRVAFMLHENDLAAAAALVEKVLDTNLVCLIPYYNLLYALNAGLLILDGKNGGMQTMLNNMRTSTVISTGTLDLMENINDKKNRSMYFQKLQNGKNTFLWFHWLMNCNRVRQNTQLLNPSISGKCLKHPHEERLLEALPQLK